MSSTIKPLRNRKSLIGLGAAGILAAALFMPATGADFTASDNFGTTVQTATLSVELKGDGDGKAFALSYQNLVPGEPQGREFTVTNTGSIAASVSLTNRTTSNTAGARLTGADWEEFRSGVEGYTGMVKSNVGLNADLGVLQPGESRTYVLVHGLEESAGNEWQGVGLTTNVVVTLNQL